MTPDARLYNSQIIDLYIRLLRKKYPHVDLGDLLRHAGMTLHQIADPGHWFTQMEVNRFHDRLAEVSGNHDISFEAGRFSASVDTLGFVRQWTLSMLGPMKTFSLLQANARNLTRSSVMEARPTGKSSVEVVVTPCPGVQEEGFQCRNRTGFFFGFFDVLDYPPPRIDHPECIGRGDAVCRYHISWDAPLSARLRRISVATAVAAGAAAVWSVVNAAVTPLAVLAAIAAPILWAFAERADRERMKRTVSELEGGSMKLLADFSSYYTTSDLAREFGELVTTAESPEVIAELVLQKIRDTLPYSKGGILLSYDTTLVVVSSYGFSRQEYDILKQPFALTPEGRSLFDEAGNGLKPLVCRLDETPPEAVPGGVDFVNSLGMTDFVCSPIVCDRTFVGILLLQRAAPQRPLLQADINLLTAITNMTGISIRNARLMEEHIRQYRTIIELEEAMREIAAAEEKNQRYLAELEQMNEEVKNFTYIASHDLKAPLVNIKGFAAELRSSVGEIGPHVLKLAEALDGRERKVLELAIKEDIPEAVSFIESSVTRMDRLINALLKLSRLGRSELNPEEVDLTRLVGDILQTLTHQLEQRGVSVTVEDLPVVHADRTVMEQIFGNLLDNAVKYLSPDRPGYLRIGAKRDGNEILFTVADNGRGIAATDIHKVFDLFRRSGKQDVAGEGMGLSYVKTLVRRHDGRIWCESEEGAGTTFFFTLPESHPPAPSVPPPA